MAVLSAKVRYRFSLKFIKKVNIFFFCKDSEMNKLNIITGTKLINTHTFSDALTELSQLELHIINWSFMKIRCKNSVSSFMTCTKKQEWVLTRAAAHVFRHDAAEVPEAWLTAVTLQSPNTRLTGALTGGWVTCLLVGAVDITLTGTWWEQINTDVTINYHRLYPDLRLSNFKRLLDTAKYAGFVVW